MNILLHNIRNVKKEMRKLKAINLLESYKEFKLKKNSPNTISGYTTDLKQFFSFLDKDFEDIIETDIELFIKSCLSKNHTPQTINRKLVSLRRFIDYLNNLKDYENKICVEIELLKVQKQEFLTEVISMNDFERLVRLAEREKDCRALAIFNSLYYTGLRISELITLKVSDKDKKDVSVLGKGSKFRGVIVSDKLIDCLNDYIKERKHNPTDHLFLNKTKNTPMSRQSIHNLIKKYAGLSKVKLSKAHAHSFRHLYCLRLIEEGCSLDEVAELAGHVNINTTRIYTRKTKQELVNIINKKL